MSVSAEAFQAQAALRARPCLVRTVLAAGFGRPKQRKPGNPAPAKVFLFVAVRSPPARRWFVCPIRLAAHRCFFCLIGLFARPRRRPRFVCLFALRSQHCWAPWQAATKWDPGWKAVQDAREKEKAKRAAEEARRTSADAVIGKQFQEKVAQVRAAGMRACIHAWRARWPLVAVCPSSPCFHPPPPTQLRAHRTGRGGGSGGAGSAQRRWLLRQGQLSWRGGLRYDARRCPRTPPPSCRPLSLSLRLRLRLRLRLWLWLYPCV